jgi:hypothetical protein
MIPFFDLKQVNEPYLKIFQENLPVIIFDDFKNDKFKNE